MTDNIDDTTDTFTTDSAPDEQAFTRTADDAVADASYFRGGTGKTDRLIEVMAAVSDHDDTEPEWFDPKGETEREDTG